MTVQDAQLVESAVALDGSVKQRIQELASKDARRFDRLAQELLKN